MQEVRRRLRRWRRRLRTSAANARIKKADWERNWQVESARPTEQLATTVPKELLDAVADGWIAQGSAVMDVGSGRGQISAWLAERGFTVLGADIADAATELARRHFGGIGPHLEFRTLNVCLEDPEPARFDAIVDRGCFHGLGGLADKYVENVAIWSRPGARLLLFHKVDARRYGSSDLGAMQAALERHIRRTFEPRYEIERAGPTAAPLERSVGQIPRVVKPGMVFWMTRR